MKQYQSQSSSADDWTNTVFRIPTPRARGDDNRCIMDGQNNYLWVYGDPVRSFARYRPNGRPGFMLQAIANQFEVEIFFEHYEDEPSYVPLGTPTDEEIAVMRAEWRAECTELDRELENFRVTWRGKEITRRAEINRDEGRSAKRRQQRRRFYFRGTPFSKFPGALLTA
jgi:hypothetical protein